MRKLRKHVWLLAVASFLAAGCVGIPAQEMSDARQALRAAEEVGAAKRAAAEYEEARILLEDANRFLAEGRYELARVVAARAKKMAIAARKASLQEPGTASAP